MAEATRTDKRGRLPAAGPARLLIDAGNGAGIADKHGRAQPADVDAQFEGVGGDDGLERAGAQALFDLATLGRKVAANGSRGWRNR